MKKLMWSFAYRSGLAGLVRWRNRHRMLVVTYHGVLREANSSFLNRNCVSVDGFRRQVDYLARNYRLLGLDEALEAVARGGAPPSSALITFDDGFRNNHDLALPVLEAAGAPAVVFVATGMLDDPGSRPWVEEVSAMLLRTGARRVSLRGNGASFDVELDSAEARQRASDAVRGYMKLAGTAERESLLEQLRRQSDVPDESYEAERFAFMDWDQARALADRGVAIGSHTVNHVCLASLSDSELRREIEHSKRRIEEETGRPCRALAYPDGTARSFGERDKLLLRELGFAGAFSQIPGYNGAGADAFALKRFNVPGGTADWLTFVATITGLREIARRMGI